MTELNRAWAQLLDDAAGDAARSGRDNITDYLRLKASNDLIRTKGVEWLITTLLEIASPYMRDHASLKIDRIEPHTFRWGSSTMVGTGLEIRHGLRCMSVETGWARRPADGVMREGALAFCRISHFGMPLMIEEFRLVRAEPLPFWSGEGNVPLRSEVLERHIRVVVDS